MSEGRILYKTDDGDFDVKPDAPHFQRLILDAKDRVVRREIYYANNMTSYTESEFTRTKYFDLEVERRYRPKQKSRSLINVINREADNVFYLASTTYIQKDRNYPLEIHFVYDASQAFSAAIYNFYDNNGVVLRSIVHSSSEQVPHDIRYTYDLNGNIESEIWYNNDGSIKRT